MKFSPDLSLHPSVLVDVAVLAHILHAMQTRAGAGTYRQSCHEDYPGCCSSVQGKTSKCNKTWSLFCGQIKS